MQPAGKFRHVGTLQSRVETQNPSTGAIEVTWSDFETGVRSDIRYLGGLETIRADAQTAVRKASIRIRYRPSVVETMRYVQESGPTFYIKSISLDSTGKREIDLVCESGVSDG